MFKFNNQQQVGKTSKIDEVSGVPGETKRQQGIMGCPTILTGLSHEVRTYMNSIVAFSYLLNNDECSENEKKEFNEHIITSAEQLITLFDNFLDSALLETTNPGNTFHKQDIGNLLNRVMADLNRVLARAGKENLRLILDPQGVMNEIYVDEEKVHRVFINLFHNALENTSSGYIRMGCSRTDHRVIFYVIDSGEGFALSKDLLTASKINGYILKNINTFNIVGLSLARKLVENMGGRIWIEPNGPGGSAIYFSIPDRNIPETGKYTKETIKSRIAY
ncbi:MAG: HAMP domain-containing histidine kinase [Bacteroidales bacterium]|nr:HAMP domain-containing histidine kinase [Bacteroidales bacterium]